VPLKSLLEAQSSPALGDSQCRWAIVVLEKEHNSTSRQAPVMIAPVEQSYFNQVRVALWVVLAALF